MRRNSNLEAVLAKFDGAKRVGGGYMVRCPAHEDRDPSLAISEGENGKIIYYCHAGCTFENIVAKLGSVEVATYDYTDENGELLYQSVRMEPKEFRQRKPVANGDWVWKLGDVRRVLFNLPKVVTAETVVIVEGEKDALTAASLGFTATTNSGGAKNWKPEFVESLKGKHIVITPDNDKPGEEYLERVASSLRLIAASIKVARVPEKYKDISEWNPSKEAYALLVENAVAWSPDKEPENWRATFHTFEEFENAPPLQFSIEGFLQKDALTAIAGLSGHGKTFIALSICRALLFGPCKLWNWFPCIERAERVVYLIPESTLSPFKHRLKLMGLYEELRNDRLLVRTLTKGKTPELDDKTVKWASRGAHVIVDTAIRFVGDADDNSASEVARGLSEDLMNLLGAGAISVIPLFHSSKDFRNKPEMNLENMIRGSGELGAILATAWGIKQIDAQSHTVYVQNLKPRDFEPCGPFQLIGRPNIDQTQDFGMYKAPTECGPLSEEQPRVQKSSNKDRRDFKATNVELYNEWTEVDPGISSKELQKMYQEKGINVSVSTIRGYGIEARKGKK